MLVSKCLFKMLSRSLITVLYSVFVSNCNWLSLICRNISWTVGYPPWWWRVRLSTLPSDRTTTSPLLSSVTSTSFPHPRVSPVSTKSTRRSTSNWPQWLPIRKSIYVFVRVTAAGPGICSLHSIMTF